MRFLSNSHRINTRSSIEGCLLSVAIHLEHIPIGLSSRLRTTQRLQGLSKGRQGVFWGKMRFRDHFSRRMIEILRKYPPKTFRNSIFLLSYIPTIHSGGCRIICSPGTCVNRTESVSTQFSMIFVDFIISDPTCKVQILTNSRKIKIAICPTADVENIA